jgi:hypothetical protein
MTTTFPIAAIPWKSFFVGEHIERMPPMIGAVEVTEDAVDWF